VGEESHLEEMRSAIRGDFARLAERRGEQELLRVDEEHGAAPVEPPEQEQPAPDEEPEASRSWFARVLLP
jgi:hypothetical protein